MSAGATTPKSKHQQVIDLYLKGMTGAEITKTLGFPIGTVSSSIYRHRLSNDAASGQIPVAPAADQAGITSVSVDQSGAATTVTVSSTRPMTPEEALEAARFDRTRWRAVKAKGKTYPAWIKNANNEIESKTMYSLAVDAEPLLPGGMSGQELGAAIAEGFGDAVREPAPQHNAPTTGYAAMVTSGEPHFGKLAWHEETGENYDLEIAYSRFVTTHAANAARLRRYGGIDRIVFRVGDDFYNAEATNATTAGTPQEMDGRWHKVFRMGGKAIVAVIDIYRTIAPVEVIICPGNHDAQVMFYQGDRLDAFYTNDPQVTVRNEPAPRHYWRWGRVLVQMAHGNEEKDKDYLGLMRLEAKQDWCETDVHETHLGHLHKTGQKEKITIGRDEALGHVLERLRSMSGTDAWHGKKGYRGALKAIDTFIYHQDTGREAHWTPRAIDPE